MIHPPPPLRSALRLLLLAAGLVARFSASGAEAAEPLLREGMQPPPPLSQRWFIGDGGEELALPSVSGWTAAATSSSSTTSSSSSLGRNLVVTTAKCYNGSRAQLLRDPGFERIPLGPLPNPTGIWSVFRTTRVPNVRVNGVATLSADRNPPRRFSKRQMLLSIPDTISMISNRAAIVAAIAGCNKTNVVYEVTVDVKWMNAAFNRTAILSLWTVHPSTADAYGGSFSGVDYWIANSTWNRFRYRFMLPNRKMLHKPPNLILALYPNQTPRVTTIRIDNLRVTEVCALGKLPAPLAPVEMLQYGTFDMLPLGNVEDNSTYFDVQRSASNYVSATIVQEDGANPTNQQMRMVLPTGNTNYDWKQIGEVVTLQMGTRYIVTSKMKRNSDPTRHAIVNFRMQSVETGVWYGRVDQILPKHNDWHAASYVVGIPETGPYLISLQLLGWGNYGQELDVSFDDFSCKPIP
jgi:hypothetical protein